MARASWPVCRYPSPPRYRPIHNRLGQSRRHRRGNPKRRVDAKEIIPDRPNRDHMRVVLEFLAERIREPSEAAIVHPHCEIGALGIAG